MKQRLHGLLLTGLVGALLAFAPLAASAATPSAQNDRIFKAADAYEGLTESALGGNAAKIAKAYQAAKAEQSATRALLTPDTAARFDKLFDELTAVQSKQDRLAVALQSAELYKLLVSAGDAAALVVPMEVSLLDYIGFRTNALLKAATPDWTALAATAHEGNGYWAKIRDRVTDQKLQTRMEQAQAGLATAAAKKDAALSASSARRDLDLVDELEEYFAKK